MPDTTMLTATQIRYLLVLNKLNCADGIKGSAIAAELGLSKPSVHNMMDTFIGLGFIEKGPGGRVLMTGHGLRAAREYTGYFKSIKAKLGLQAAADVTLDRAICAFLAELSAPCRDGLTRMSA